MSLKNNSPDSKAAFWKKQNNIKCLEINIECVAYNITYLECNIRYLICKKAYLTSRVLNRSLQGNDIGQVGVGAARTALGHRRRRGARGGWGGVDWVGI